MGTDCFSSMDQAATRRASTTIVIAGVVGSLLVVGIVLVASSSHVAQPYTRTEFDTTELMFDSPAGRPVSCKFWDCGDEDGDCVERVMKESQDAGDKDMTANKRSYMRGVAAPKECSPTTALTSLKACVDKNSNGCRGYLNSDKQACNYQSFLADCPKTCGQCDKLPLPSCVDKASVGSCQKCGHSDQCSVSGAYCCPFLKKCIVSGQKCYDPNADCNPRCPNEQSVETCTGCANVYKLGGWAKWAPPTCGSSAASSGSGPTGDQCLSSKQGWGGYTCERAKIEKYCNNAKWGADVQQCCSATCSAGASAKPAAKPAASGPTPDQCLSSKQGWQSYTCESAKSKYCNDAKWGADVRQCCPETCSAAPQCKDQSRKCPGWSKYCGRPDMTVGGVPLEMKCAKTCGKC